MPKKNRGAYVSAFGESAEGEEYEFLLDRNSKYKVTKVSTDEEYGKVYEAGLIQ